MCIGAAALLISAAGAGVACTCSSPPAAPAGAGSSAPVAPAVARATLAYADGASLCLLEPGASDLGAPRCAGAGAPIEQLLWLDRARVAARLEGGAVKVLEAGQWRALPMPPPSTWERPPPLDASGELALGVEASERAHLFLDRGALWLSRCPWWFLFDAGYCHEWVTARLSPEPFEARSDIAVPPGFKEEPEDLPAGEPPAGVSVEVQDPDGGDAITVVCRRGPERSARVEDTKGAHTTVAWGWIGASASAYVLRVTRDFGEGIHTDTYWMEACRPEPVRELGRLRVGPGDLWVHDGERGWDVRRGDRLLGQIQGEHPAFAPEAEGRR